jgi:anti-sigma regulatory factor (Ser/Thr protein kinase)
VTPLPLGWPAEQGSRLELAAAHPRDLAVVRAHVQGACAATGASADVRDALALAADELCANVMRHAYRDVPGPLTIDVAATPDDAARWRVTIVDAGPPFDPTTLAMPDVDAPLDARPIGGLGVHLARRSVDALRYAREGWCNVVTLEKRAAAH